MQHQWDIPRQSSELPAAAVRKLPPSESRRLYFFYDSLNNSKRHRSVFILEKELELRSAHIDGCRFMLWGSYSTLVVPSGEFVHGQTYQISTRGELEDELLSWNITRLRSTNVDLSYRF